MCARSVVGGCCCEDDPHGPRYHLACRASRRCHSHCGDDGPAPLGSSGPEGRSSESSPVMSGSVLVRPFYASPPRIRPCPSDSPARRGRWKSYVPGPANQPFPSAADGAGWKTSVGGVPHRRFPSASAPSFRVERMARRSDDLRPPLVSAPDLPEHLQAARPQRSADLITSRIELDGDADLAHSTL